MSAIPPPAFPPSVPAGDTWRSAEFCSPPPGAIIELTYLAPDDGNGRQRWRISLPGPAGFVPAGCGLFWRFNHAAEIAAAYKG